MRITGGIYRSRALRAPRGDATRPTSDRVREALFAILASAAALDGARVLDLYAGTGALALEALSRGATGATLVESSREALAALRANVAALGVEDRVRVLAAEVSRALPRLATGGPFDLVLADPPWSQVDDGQAVRALAAVARSGALSTRALVVLEHAARTPAPSFEGAGLALTDARRYGDTALAFYKPAILAPSDPPLSPGLLPDEQP
jgi:16S rRNA (guanine966-N2)-methyltransferase